MIIDFSITNFGSIKERQTLSLEADRSQHLEDHYVIHSNGFRLLKLGLIYGANASGKTTVLSALAFLKDIVLNPENKKTTPLAFQPFLFDSVSKYQNSVLSLNFLIEGIKYFYEVEFNQKAIITEVLYYGNRKKANIFKRKTNIDNQFTEIEFGHSIKKDKIFIKTLESNTLWNNTVLGGYLKTNIQIEVLKDVVDWFNNHLRPLVFAHTDLSPYIIEQIDKSKIYKDDIVQILTKADLNISDILINKEEKDISDDFINLLETKIKISTDAINKLKDKGKLISINLELEHSVGSNTFSLPFKAESEGTRRFFAFAGLLSLLAKESVVLPIDEIEASLHPELFNYFLISFLLNSNNSQIIATTHHREVFMNKDIFRNDAIWITEKNTQSSTELYSLSDFDSSVIRDTTNIYNVYKTGKIGGIPNLGDYYIDISNEKE